MSSGFVKTSILAPSENGVTHADVETEVENEAVKAIITPQYGGKVWSVYHKQLKREFFMRNPALLDDDDEQEYNANAQADCVCLPVTAPKRRRSIPTVSGSGGRLGPPGSGMDHMMDSSERGHEDEEEQQFRTPEKERTWPGVAPARGASAVATPPPPPPPLPRSSLTDERGRVRHSSCGACICIHQTNFNPPCAPNLPRSRAVPQWIRC